MQISSTLVLLFAGVCSSVLAGQFPVYNRPTPSTLECTVGFLDNAYHPGNYDFVKIDSKFRLNVISEGIAPFTLSDERSSYRNGLFLSTVTSQNPVAKWLYTIKTLTGAHGGGARISPIRLPPEVRDHRMIYPFYDMQNKVVRLLTADTYNMSIGVLSALGNYTVEFFYPSFFAGHSLLYFCQRIDFNDDLSEYYLWFFENDPEKPYDAKYTLSLNAQTGEVSRRWSTVDLPSRFPPMAWNSDHPRYSWLQRVFDDRTAELLGFYPAKGWPSLSSGVNCSTPNGAKLLSSTTMRQADLYATYSLFLLPVAAPSDARGAEADPPGSTGVAVIPTFGDKRVMSYQRVATGGRELKFAQGAICTYFE